MMVRRSTRPNPNPEATPFYHRGRARAPVLCEAPGKLIEVAADSAVAGRTRHALFDNVTGLEEQLEIAENLLRIGALGWHAIHRGHPAASATRLISCLTRASSLNAASIRASRCTTNESNVSQPFLVSFKPIY